MGEDSSEPNSKSRGIVEGKVATTIHRATQHPPGPKEFPVFKIDLTARATSGFTTPSPIPLRVRRAIHSQVLAGVRWRAYEACCVTAKTYSTLPVEAGFPLSVTK